MKPNVNQDDINGKADRREAAFNSNIVVGGKIPLPYSNSGFVTEMQSFLTICYMNTLWPEAWWFMIIVRKKERKGEKSTLWCVKNISYRHKGLFSAVYKRDKNEASRIDLKDTIHDLLQKRVISKLVYVTLFLFLHVNRNKVNNVIDTLHVTTAIVLLYK